MLLLSLGLGMLLCPNPAHVGSKSVTRIQVRDTGIQARTQVQVLSVLEVLPALDGDGDGFVDPEEVTLASEKIAAMLTKDYGLRSGDQSLPMTVGEAFLLPPHPDSYLDLAEWIEVPWSAPAATERRLAVWSRLFLETSPDHTDSLAVEWPGRLPALAVLSWDQSEQWLEPGPARWKAWGQAFAKEAWAAGLLAMAAVALLVGLERGRLRFGHAALLLLGLAAGARWAEELQSWPGAHLLPLVALLGTAYCAIDRAAFGMQRPHLVEALVLALSWGASLRVPFSRLELELDPLEARLGPALVAGAVLVACSLLARWPQGSPARALVAVAGAGALARFLLLAFG